jgi:PKD repeat protein
VDVTDFYKLTMPVDGTNSLKVTVKATNKSTTNSSIGYRLWSKTGQQLENRTFSISGGLDGTAIDSLTYRTYLLDTCYVEIYNPYNHGDYPKEYELTCLENPQIHSDKENNDSIPVALPLAINTPAKGLIGFKQQTQGQYKVDISDFYKIAAPLNGQGITKVFIKAANKTSTNSSIGLRLWTSAGVQIGQRSISVGGGLDGTVNTSILFPCNNGDTPYYLEIYNPYNHGDWPKEYEISYVPEDFKPGFEVVQFNNQIRITNTSNGDRFNWTFGDGTTKNNVTTPEHTYARPGEYVIVQTARFNAINSDMTARDTVIIRGIDSYSPKTIGNEGASSIVIYGGGLNETTKVWLIQGSTTIAALNMEKKALGQILATFRPDGIPLGTYDLRIQNAGLVDTVFKAGVRVEGRIYPKVVSSIESADNFRLRTGFTSIYQLVLRNTGNVDALGVSAYVGIPDEIEIETARKDFRELIDATKTFNYYCGEFKQAYSIPNADIARMADLLNYESLPVDSVFEEPFSGRIYQIYVPKIAAGGSIKIPLNLKSLSTSADPRIISAVGTPNTFNPAYSNDSIPAAMVSKLNNYVDLFIGTMDMSVLMNATDSSTWKKTFKIADDLVRKILVDDRDRIGYDISKMESMLDNNYYDNGLINKQMATFMLTLIAIAKDHSIEQRADGIINFASVPTDEIQNAKTSSLRAAPEPGTPEYQEYADRQLSKVENFLEWVFNNRHNPEQNNRDNQSSENFWNNLLNIFIDKGLEKTPHPINEYLQQAPDVAAHGYHVVKNPPLLDELLYHANDPYYQYQNEDNGRKDSKKTPPITIRTSFDPNDITGPAGINKERYIVGAETMGYVIRFENKAEAGLPAMFINISDTLDVNVYDLSTFELSHITIGDTVLEIPAGRTSYIMEYDMRPAKNYIVGISAALNAETGVVRWNMTTLDPATRDRITDLEGGFLPPNINAPEGEGSVSFSVKLKDKLPHKAVVANKADIIFDYNETISTNLWENTLDIVSPVSSVKIEQLSDSTCKIKWTAKDVESGVHYHKLYAKINDGKFFPMGNFFSDEMIFMAVPDTLYSFYVEAVDHVGNAEHKPEVAEVSIQLTWTKIPSVAAGQASLSVAVIGGVLKIAGLEAEKPFNVYNLQGISVYKGIASATGEASVKLSDHGAYIIQSSAGAAKVVF